ncbi:MAG: signal peptidase I [Bacilli bacterium]
MDEFIPRSERNREKPTRARKSKEKKRLGRELKEWTISILIAFAVVFGVRTFLFTPTMVEGESMMPTLHNGDRLVVQKFGSIDRFDLVVFKSPEGTHYIKRIIGLPGDHIAYNDDILYINGKAYEEPYLNEAKRENKEERLTYNFAMEELDSTGGVKQVPEDSYFVLGDNRQWSKDSRLIGFVKRADIIGEASLVFYPFNRFGFPESE